MNMSGNYEGDVRQRVSGPATALLATGIIGIVLQAIGLMLRMLNVGIFAAATQQPGVDAGQMQALAMIQGVAGVVIAIIGSVVGVVIIIGALKMKRLESYGLAMAASIVAMIPCISPCCLLGIPFGIWAIVVLNKPEVKAAFR